MICHLLRYRSASWPGLAVLTTLLLTLAAGQGSAQAQSKLLVDELPDPQHAEDVRDLMLDIFDNYEVLLGHLGGQHLMPSIERARDALNELDAEQLVGMQNMAGAEYAQLHQETWRLRNLVAESQARAPQQFRPKTAAFPVPVFDLVPRDDEVVSAPGGREKESNCDDSVDNDGDTFTDCEDPDCTEDAACADSSLSGGGEGTLTRLECSLADPPTPEAMVGWLIGAKSTEIVAAVAQAFCDLDILGFNCSICCIPTNVLAVVANWVVDAIALCDGFLADALAQSSHARLEHIHDDQHVVEGTVDRIETQVGLMSETTDVILETSERIETQVGELSETADEILDTVSCKIVPVLRAAHGCDGIDSDCNDVVDDCSEDIFPPVLHVDSTVSSIWHASIPAAVDAVRNATLAFDACQSVDVSESSSGACGAVSVTVTARDTCGNETQVIVPVLVDAGPPDVSLPSSLAGTCFPDVGAAEAAIRAAAILSDDCTAVADLGIRVESTVTECSLLIRLEATDAAGTSSSDTVMVRVDPKPPVLHVDAAVSNPWFASPAVAIAAVARAVTISDDCAGALVVDPPVLSGSCGAVTASVTARDGCGNETTTTTLVRIDGTAPAVVMAPGIEGTCHPSVAAAEAAVLTVTAITDDCTLPGAFDVRVDSTVTECSLRVRVEAIDEAGHRTVAATTVRVDTGLPIVEIERLLLGFRGEVLGFQTPPCFASIAEAEAAVLAVTRVADNCTAAEDIAVAVTSTGDACSLTVTVTGTDGCGTEGTDSVTVRVDPDPPTTSCDVTEDELWPANHEMIDVGFTFDAFDGCTGEPEVQVSITSDERTASASGAGGSTPAPDAEILRDLDGSIQGILIRAERSSQGNGRVYEITVEARDDCGNVQTSSCTVSVPPNGNRDAVDDGQYFDATGVF